MILLCLILATTVAATNVEIIIDASGSMTEEIDGVPKMEIAKDMINDFIQTIPADTVVTFRAFGSNIPACQSRKIVDFTADKLKLSTALLSLQAAQTTPIEVSIVAAYQDFIGKEKEKNFIILVSDGGETCEGDPCTKIESLANEYVTVYSVGFDIDERGKEQLTCVAKKGGGSYYDTTSADDLEAIFEVLKEAIIGVSPGTSFDTAPLITPGQYGIKYNGQYEDQQTEFYYKIQVPEAELLNARVFVEASGEYVFGDIEIYDENKDQVSWDSLTATSKTSSEYVLSYPPTHADEGHLRYIRLEGDKGYPWEQFILKVELLPRDDAASGSDAAGDFGNALEIEPRDYEKNSLYYNDKLDIMKLNVPDDVVVTIRVTPTTDSQIGVMVYNIDREEIAKGGSNNEGAIAKTIFNTATMGQVYLKIYNKQSYLANNIWNYKIDIDFENADECGFITCESFEKCVDGNCVALDYTETGMAEQPPPSDPPPSDPETSDPPVSTPPPSDPDTSDLPASDPVTAGTDDPTVGEPDPEKEGDILIYVLIGVIVVLVIVVLFLVLGKKKQAMTGAENQPTVPKPKNIDPEIAYYVKKAKAAGKTDDQIREELKNAGWPPEKINF